MLCSLCNIVAQLVTCQKNQEVDFHRWTVLTPLRVLTLLSKSGGNYPAWKKIIWSTARNYVEFLGEPGKEFLGLMQQDLYMPSSTSRSLPCIGGMLRHGMSFLLLHFLLSAITSRLISSKFIICVLSLPQVTLVILNILIGKGIRPGKSSVLVGSWWQFDWSFPHLIAPVVTTTSIILTPVKSRMETIWYRLTQVHLEKWPLNWRGRKRESLIFDSYSCQCSITLTVRFLLYFILLPNHQCQNTEREMMRMSWQVITDATLHMCHVTCSTRGKAFYSPQGWGRWTGPYAIPRSTPS